MNLRYAFIWGAIVAGIFGLLFVIVPEFALSVFDFSLNDQGYFMTRLFGGALLGYAVVNWLVKDGPPSEARRYYMLGIFTDSLVAVIVFIIAFIQQIGNLLMLVPFIIHVSLVVWFGYLYWKNIN